jgi:CPA2 family monovalent cation:H+ antiporter-2
LDHEVPLIATVAMSFVIAFVFGFLANRINLPPLVGYLVAGIVVGPFSPGFVADPSIANQLAEMGVILLMFGVGLHLSVADLMAVSRVAVPGALGRIVLMTPIGIGLAAFWGWGLGAGVVLGISLAVASTAVVLKALEDRNGLATVDGRIAIGWLIVEDLAMVLTLVLLPAFVGSATGLAHPAAGDDILLSVLITLGKVGAFMALAMLLGPKVVPWLLKQVARTGSRELFTLSVLALALGIAYGSAELFGVSFALGAFFAGLILSESDFSHRAAAESLPMQDAFAILFFVSVGMLFDPSILLREPLAVAAVLTTIIVGKLLVTFAIVLALGYPVATALTVAASLAQIGEFSFILAGLGVATGQLPPEGRDLILAGALLSVTLNPIVFAASDWLLTTKSFSPFFSKRIGSYGQHSLSLLQGQLDVLRKRMEARETNRSLQIQNIIDRFPIFAELDQQAREDLLMLFRPRTAAPGERIIRTGDRADAAYFISSGAVQVKVGDRRIRLEAGQFFGEMALLSGRRRSADVTAVDFCQFQTLEKRDFRSFLTRYPQLRSKVMELAARRSEMNQQAGRTDPAVAPDQAAATRSASS